MLYFRVRILKKASTLLKSRKALIQAGIKVNVLCGSSVLQKQILNRERPAEVIFQGTSFKL